MHAAFLLRIFLMGVHSEDRGFYLKAIPGGTFALLYKQGYDSENQNSEYIYTHVF